MRLTLAALLLFSISLAAQEKPRVFITDSQSWEMSGGGGGTSSGFGGGVHGGARPQKAEIIKTFGEKCPGVTVNNIQDKADYVVLLDHEGGKGWIRKDNKVAVFNKAGDSIVSKSTRSLGGSVEEACNAITKDWPGHATAAASQPATPAEPSAAAKSDAPAPEMRGAKLQVTSEPAGADIELDGSFVGNTPSTIDVGAGEHTVVVKKNGYKDWQKKLKTSGGSINLAAELEKSPS